MPVAEPPRRRPLWEAAADLLGGRARELPKSSPSDMTEGGMGWGPSLLEGLPDPALIVVGASQSEPTGWRFVLANAAARETLRIVREEGPVVTVLRDPAILDAVSRSLFDGAAAEARYEVGGPVQRSWRVMVRPLLLTGNVAERHALLMLRDETDVRRADRTRADFLANASHELRTPLASLLGFIETLRGHARADPAAREKFLGIMQVQAERMSRLIDDLMSLSRIELNEHIPPSSEADVVQVARDVLDAISPLAADKEVGLAPSMPPLGDALLVADRDQIVQVAQNLIDNALKYSQPGACVRVDVEADVASPESAPPPRDGWARFWVVNLEHAPEQRYICLRVSDAGPGLAREHLPRLAERFYRVEGQKSGERSGTGLGLAIVKHIVSRHHGALLVESAPGEGSVFSVFLPKKPVLTL
jgi:two-component system phosphate regulon sensor histidine kinase PhoR